MEYEAVIGLEVHVQLKTKTKAFCGCSTEFGQEPNTQVCPVCLGFPGSLPVLNKQAFIYSAKVGLALNCSVQEYTKFDRKHYYYPDLPKNFQISQYDLPISKDGFLDIYIDSGIKRIRIKRAHLEEDAGKLIHAEGKSLVDFNRAGIPLLEIVTEPDINSAEEAYEYLTALKSIISYLDVSDCDMEKGSLRCDANISIRPKGTSGLGTKAELKNMNSFKGVKDALNFELQRQIELVNRGEKVIQETLLWDEKAQKTIVMRTKEEAKDYRYFPEPDLPLFVITNKQAEEIKMSIPELPQQKLARFIKDYGLSENDARILVADKKKADDVEEKIKKWPDKNKKSVVNWYIGPFASIASSSNVETYALKLKVPDKNFLELIDLVEKKQLISNLTGKVVLEKMSKTGEAPLDIIQKEDLAQISDTGKLEEIAAEVVAENPKSVVDFKAGKDNALMFLVGQVMKKSQGKANPKAVQEILRRRLTDA